MVKGAILFQPHDLVSFDPSALEGENLPDWVIAAVNIVPFAVIRRMQILSGLLPVGVRGKERHQRWGGFLPLNSVRDCLKPAMLVNKVKDVPAERLKAIPALSALKQLVDRFQDTDWNWGPTGSLGFELASGHVTAKPTSDLDLIVRCNEPIYEAETAFLLDITHDLDARCDILIETPLGGVALQEFANKNGPVVVRTITGPCLMNNPWFKG